MVLGTGPENTLPRRIDLSELRRFVRVLRVAYILLTISEWKPTNDVRGRLKSKMDAPQLRILDQTALNQLVGALESRTVNRDQQRLRRHFLSKQKN